MTPQDLTDAGYVMIRDQTAASSLGDWYRNSYQKRIYDEVGARYFITIAHGQRPRQIGGGDFFVPKNQFTKGSVTFNVEMLRLDETIAEIEAFFADLWTTMRLDYYEGRISQQGISS